MLASPGGLIATPNRRGVVDRRPAALFYSDFSSGLLDPGKPLPWTSRAGNGTLSQVVGGGVALGFPTPNVLHVVAQKSAINTTVRADQVILGATGVGALPVLGVGESRFYRWYVAYTVPDTVNPAGAAPHGIGDGIGGTQNWWHETTIQQNGTWGPRIFSFAGGGNASPNNRWAVAAALAKGTVYRIEFRVQRTGALTFIPDARLYAADGTLLYGSADFKNNNGLGATTFASAPVLALNASADTTLAQFMAGTNGPQWTSAVEADYPFSFCYIGGIAIRSDDWCGPYGTLRGEG